MTVSDEKRALRKRMRTIRDGIPAERRAAASEAICRKACQRVKAGSTVLVYASFRSEVDTHPLIRLLHEMGCRVCLPMIGEAGAMDACELPSDGETAPDRYGIETPKQVRIVPSERIDAVFLPGLSFDRRGGRLGYGAGYYDRYLRRTSARRIALAFISQIVESVPCDENDVSMDEIITENENMVLKSS